MHSKMNRNQNEVFGEDVNVASFRPSLHSRVTIAHEFGVEERVEGVNGRETITSSSIHQHVHVEVDNLRQKHKEHSLIARRSSALWF